MKLLALPLLAAASSLLVACTASPKTETPATTTASVPAAAADTLTAPPLDISSNVAPSGEADPTGPTAPHATEQALLQSGAYAILYGTQLSQLAATKAPSAGMQEFAGSILKDYARSLTYLQPAAASANVQLPTSLDAAHKAQVAALSKLSGQVFTAEYVAQVKTSSQLLANTLAAYRQQGLPQTTDLQTWIGATLPIAENHLGMVMEVEQGKTKL